ncbi:hypothetical protein P8452_76872 [Trifolium repens]|nr:hypothetical protein P8452_76872 [Trifolium repens]
MVGLSVFFSFSFFFSLEGRLLSIFFFQHIITNAYISWLILKRYLFNPSKHHHLFASNSISILAPLFLSLKNQTRDL